MRSYEFTSFLKIRHPDIDPQTLTDELGIVPEHCWKAGERRAVRGDSRAAGTDRESYWVGQTYPESYWVAQLPLADYIPQICTPISGTLMLGALLLERHKTFWRQLQAEGATATLLVSVDNREAFNLELPRDLLVMMAGLGLSVSFDIQSEQQAAA